MIHPLRYLFFLLVVRPIVLIVLGLNIRRRDLLPTRGPAIVVANHNSHLDALILMTLFGMKRLKYVRPVAAADVFMRGGLIQWFATSIIGIIPIERNVKGMRVNPLAAIKESIDHNDIVIIFPEGQRGEPEKLEQFKTGVAHLAKAFPDVPLTPIFMHGVGKALPRGEGVLVPFFIDLFVGEPFRWTGDKRSLMALMIDRLQSLAHEGHFPE